MYIFFHKYIYAYVYVHIIYIYRDILIIKQRLVEKMVTSEIMMTKLYVCFITSCRGDELLDINLN